MKYSRMLLRKNSHKWQWYPMIMHRRKQTKISKPLILENFAKINYKLKPQNTEWTLANLKFLPIILKLYNDSMYKHMKNVYCIPADLNYFFHCFSSKFAHFCYKIT